jgi:quercetin dioxygenase-like cupin family protein
MFNERCTDPSLDDLSGDVAMRLLVRHDGATESDNRALLCELKDARAVALGGTERELGVDRKARSARPIGNGCRGRTMVQNMEVVLKRFEQPDEVRTFEKGKFEIVRIGGMTIGRATYEPGWRWSLHIGPATGASSCSVEHVGMVVSGRATAAMDNGTIVEMRPGDVFHIAPGHDSWVVGAEPYVSLHFLGADHYADRH